MHRFSFSLLLAPWNLGQLYGVRRQEGLDVGLDLEPYLGDKDNFWKNHCLSRSLTQSSSNSSSDSTSKSCVERSIGKTGVVKGH